jgi:integration host factor subunit beta
MNRSDLHTRLSELHPQLPAKDVKLAVKVILDTISATLLRGGRVEIRGFGCFGLNYRPPRQGRNPKNGDKVKVPAKYVPHFKAGKEMRERVGQTISGSSFEPLAVAVLKNFQPAGFLKTTSKVV